MAKLIYALNQSLDGFVDHDRFAPDATLFAHFIEDVRGLAGSIYGRRMYEIMGYWDDERPEWGEPERAYAEAWRAMPKWVVSGTLNSVGPNAQLVRGDIAARVAELKASQSGALEIAGPALASSLFDSGLIDEYRIYLHPAVLGHGKPYFMAVPPPLRLAAQERFGDSAIRLTYVPA